jgi:hypothetical protein
MRKSGISDPVHSSTPHKRPTSMSSAPEKLNICAIIAVRNEVRYLKVLLPYLAEQDIDVAIIDNESTDSSHELYSEFMGNPIIRVDTLPYRGCFSLSDQLAAKERIAKEIDHDWVIHHDADEIMEHRLPGKSLYDAIHEADTSGHNVINFDEFVFLPEPHADYSNSNYYTGILRYYFFEPRKNRLNRAWKRSSRFINVRSGGHKLEGSDISISPINHILRHYIVLSEEHARTKYLKRIFDSEDISRGWHGNRLNFTPENLLLPIDSDSLHCLHTFDSKDFIRKHAVDKHFWQW